jgi:D-threo-aldose 1-dehydrogenase
MDPFARRRLGRTSMELPLLGFGAAPIANLYAPTTEAEAQATLSAAWDAGLRFYDTSPWYGRGLSELRVGAFLRDKPRDDYLLTTKVGRVFAPPADLAAFLASKRSFVHGLPLDHRYDYTYDGVMRSLEQSFVRMGLARIDALLIHDLDVGNLGEELTRKHMDELVRGGGHRALSELKSAGKIKAVGAGINHMGTIPQFLDTVELDFFLVASPYTLVEQPVLDGEFPRLEKAGAGVIIGQPFASGILATGPVAGARYKYGPAPTDVLEKVGKIKAVCERHGVPLAAAALQFVVAHPLVASVIPGAYTPAEVASNVTLLQHEIPPALWTELKRDGLLREDAPTGA